MGLLGKKETLPINRVKFMGVRTAEQTKILATYNSTLYCFLIEYEDGSRELVEYNGGDKKLNELLQYIDMGPEQ